MYKLRRFDITRSKEIYQSVIDFVNQIKVQLPVTTVYLYGSLLNGQINEGSDIDLLIIGNFTEPFFERIFMVMKLTNLPIEPIVYTPDEFNKMKDQKNPFILEILKTGKEL